MSGAIAAINGRIIRAFANAHAFSEAEAKSVKELGLQIIEHGAIFQRLVQRGKIIKTADGRFYMDRAFYDTRMRRRKIMLPVLCGVSICVIVMALFYLLR
jgi:hypothetical protein